MLNRIARGVPRFWITSERLSLSTRFSNLPKPDLARRAETTIPSFEEVLAIGINSPVHLFELYSCNFRLSMAKGGGSLPEARASRARRRAVSSDAVRRRWRESQRRKSRAGVCAFFELHTRQRETGVR